MCHSYVLQLHPGKKYSPGSRICSACGNHHGLILKYPIMSCRHGFRSIAKTIGFIKYR